MSKKLIPEPDEFFVGYLPEAPATTMAILKRVILVVGIGIVTLGFLLALNEREFSSANFDYGKYTTLKGFVFKSPVPHIKIASGVDSLGGTKYKTLLLVGVGKMGADKSVASFEDSLGQLDGKFVKLTGELIYGDGKSLFQISSNHVPEIIAFGGSAISTIKKLGIVLVRGEIIDPKCYFGVMKPGEGKPHRSCAIRCIAGGIPPVFNVSNTSDYYILLDENQQPINDKVLNLVGDQITLTGEAFSFDNWKILLVRKENLREQAVSISVIRNLLAMEKGMTMCGFD